MSLTPGTRIGAFEIVDKLGEGGMGEVYRARDTKLDREVALKVLPALFVSDPDRVARFEREAKVLASLNHPNIAQVYDFERPSGGSGQAAIAMELVEGATLDEVIRASGALPLDRALAILRQIAAALDAAHERGIIHRDLKPANVNVREDGTVKVLDFGLAKAFAADAEAANAELANSPTLTARSTQLGMIIGTAAYMSPEQAKGRAVDRRADVWAFGVLFFEMLAGRRAFDGEDVSDVLASVLKTDPDWNLLPADLPGPVRRLLRRCLEKDPKKRLRDVSEGMLQLDEGLASGSTASMMTSADRVSGLNGASHAPLWRRALPLAATTAAVAFIVAALGLWREEPPSPRHAARFLHVPPASEPLFSTGAYRDIAISPDGRTIAYVSQSTQGAAIYLRALDQLDAQMVRGARPAVFPFFSPDGQWVGFIDQLNNSQIKKVARLGGPAVLVTSLKTQVMGATWASDGRIIAGSRGPLVSVSDAGGEATPLTTLEAGETVHVWPWAIPNTSVVLFAAVSNVSGGILDAQLAAFDRASGRSARLKIAGLHPQYSSTGHIIYASRDGSLRAVPFDPEQLAVTGNPVPIMEGIGVKVSGAANFDISASGDLVHSVAGTTHLERSIVWVDRAGRETAIAAPMRSYFYARISPDGSRLSLDVRDEEEDIWIWDVRRDTLARLTDRAGADQYGLWTPDHRIIFSSPNFGRSEIFRHRPDGVGQPEQITDTAANPLIAFPNAITPDGKQVIFRAVATAGGKNDLFVVNLDGDRTPRKLLSTEHDERNAALSPDGAYMAFESDLSGGRFEVFVRPFPNVDGEQIKVSTDGGGEPVWSRDGREIFYISRGKLLSVPDTVRAGQLELGKPVAVFDISAYFFGGIGRNYDVAGDGKRFVMIKNPSGEASNSSPISVVLNWVDELRGRLK